MKNISIPMTAEMSAFVFKFNSLLLAGLKAKLVMECEDGVVRAHVEAVLGPAGVAHDAPAGCHHRHQARAGPARLRRRARRSEAIANARRQAGKPHPDPPNEDERGAGPPHPPATSAGHGGHQDKRGAGPPHPPAASVGNGGHQEERGAGPPHGHGGHQDERGAGPPHPPAASVGHGGHQDERGAGPPHPPAASAVHLPRIAASEGCTPPGHSPERKAAQQPAPLPAPPCDDFFTPHSVPPDYVGSLASHLKQAADPLPQEGHDPLQGVQSPVVLRPLTLSFSAVAAQGSSPKTVSRAPDLPGSPGGWGAIDPTRSESGNECDSDEESSTPQMKYVWHSPSPVRQLLTGQRPMFSTPHPHPSSPQQLLPDSSQSHHASAASLHHVIQFLHSRAAQSPFPSAPRKRQYGSAYCIEQTSAGSVRHELTSKRQLARRGGHWDVIGKDYYIDSDEQSDSDIDEYEYESDEEEN